MSNKIVMIILIFALVIIIGLAGGLFMLWGKLSSMDAQLKHGGNGTSPQEVPEEKHIQKLGPIFKLESFVVNLADSGGKRFLRCSIDLELSDSNVRNEVEVRMPQIRDAVLLVLPSKRFEDINSIEGKITLRDEMLTQLNSLLSTGTVVNLYFSEFVVQ